jgi:hypothetical protein
MRLTAWEREERREKGSFGERGEEKARSGDSV